LRRELVVGRVFGRVDLVRVVDTVLVSACRLWRVEASLGRARVSEELTVMHAVTEAYLDQVLPLGLGNEGLQLWGREGVDQTRLRHDKK
jgi:hypothetical protein